MSEIPNIDEGFTFEDLFATDDATNGECRRRRPRISPHLGPQTLSALRRLSERAESQVPAFLSDIHREITHPHEGGLNTWDSAGVTYAGITADTFRAVMQDEGVPLDRTMAAQALLAIGTRHGRRTPSTWREARRLFEDFSSYVHYQNYLVRPGFSNLPEPFQAAIYDTSFNRGNGAALMILLRAAQREGFGPFPGIHSIGDTPEQISPDHPVTRLHPQDPRNPGYHFGNIDADPVVLDRLIDDHTGRNRDAGRGLKIIPSMLHDELRAYGIDPDADGIRLVTADGDAIDWHSGTPYEPNQLRLHSPYRDNPSLYPAGDPRRADWDALVAQAVAAAEAMSQRMTPEQIIAAIERERVEHFYQIINVEPSNERNTGWFRRSAHNASFVAAHYTGRTGAEVHIAGLPENEQHASTMIASIRDDIDRFSAPPDMTSGEFSKHIELIGHTLADLEVTLIDEPSDRRVRGLVPLNIRLESILPGINYGEDDGAEDNIVLDTNAFGDAIPALSDPTAQAVINALREYYNDEEHADTINSVDAEDLGKIQLNIYHDRAGRVFVDIDEIQPTTAGRLWRQASAEQGSASAP